MAAPSTTRHHRCGYCGEVCLRATTGNGKTVLLTRADAAEDRRFRVVLVERNDLRLALWLNEDDVVTQARLARFPLYAPHRVVCARAPRPRSRTADD